MTNIYSLSIDGNVFYIGQTRQFLAVRLAGHLGGNRHIKDLPSWIKAFIKIASLEECENIHANKRERHWIRHFRDTGTKLINKNNYYQPVLKGKPRIEYKILSKLQIDFIMLHLKYLKVAKQIGVNPETIRVAVTKKRIKKEYFEKIFSLDNMLKYNTFIENQKSN